MNHIDFLQVYRHVSFNDDRRHLLLDAPAGAPRSRLMGHLRVHVGRLLVAWGSRMLDSSAQHSGGQPLAQGR